MSAAEAYETFTLSNEELEAVLRTGDTAESSIPTGSGAQRVYRLTKRGI